MAAVFAFLAIYVSGASLENMYLAISADRNKILFFLFVGIYAGMAIPLFTLNLAYVNDYMEKAKFVSAGAGMQIIFGLGAMMGPFLCSTLMSAFGTNGFFIYLLIFHLIIGLFGLYRITRREAVENPDNTFTCLLYTSPSPRD